MSLCRLVFYCTAISQTAYYKEYVFSRSDFVTGADTTLKYFNGTDVSTILADFNDYVAFVSMQDYINVYTSDSATVPDFSQGFKDFGYRYSLQVSNTVNSFVAVVEDL
jgi:hypothetical protein